MPSAWMASLVLSALLARPQDGGDDEAGERGRSELAALVQRALAEQESPQASALGEEERVFNLPLAAVEGSGVRVLSLGGEDEARRAAEAMIAARTLFSELTGTKAAFPPGLCAYLLGTDEAKTAFLTRHPEVGPERSARLETLEGAGIPGTADWGFWEGDAEKRLDAMVRFSLDWFCRGLGVTTERHAWLHEGLGFYLTHALTGTRLMWFEQPRVGESKRDAASVALRAQMDDLGSDWLALARDLFDPKLAFDLEELLHLEVLELEPADYLRAHALAAYLVEVRRPVLGTVLTRVGAGDDPRAVLEEALGCSLKELRTRLDAWLERRDVLVARAAGQKSEAELEEQWKGLDAAQRRAAVAALRRGVDALDTQQMRWLRAVVARTASDFPRAAQAPFYDPKVHAPGLPIARKRLSSGDSRVKKLLEEVRGEPDPRALVLAYDYDWGRAKVVRTEDPNDPEIAFRNALRGAPPGADLARALVLAALDHPAERALQAGFAHAYTDRDGRVYPLTLFEMWSTGTTIEMPDVDILGIVHDVLDEWKRWVSPVPPAQHGELYKVVGDLFLACRRSRELRLTLAELYLAPSAPARAGYETQMINLQTLWATNDSDPAKLASILPEGKQWEPFLISLAERSQRDFKLHAQGRRRAAQLRLDAGALRRVLGEALDEGAAFVEAQGEGDGTTVPK